jgi:predicted KAP-like P-loop ATPase
MSITIQEILYSFKKNLIRLCDDLIAILPEDSDLISVRIFADALPLVQAIETFAEVTIPYKDQITSRDEKYFLNMNGGVFNKFEGSKVLKFKDVYLSDKITSEQKDDIWKYFNAFLKLSIKYRELKENRG